MVQIVFALQPLLKLAGVLRIVAISFEIEIFEKKIGRVDAPAAQRFDETVVKDCNPLAAVSIGIEQQDVFRSFWCTARRDSLSRRHPDAQEADQEGLKKHQRSRRQPAPPYGRSLRIHAKLLRDI